MSHAKHASTKRKRSINAVPVLSAAGLSLSLASGASAAIGRPAADMLTPKTGMSHEITLCEEEISDVSLATFYIFDNEGAGTSRRGLKLAQGCGGCGGGGKKRWLWWGGAEAIAAARPCRRPNVGTFRNKCSPRPDCRRRSSSPATRRGASP
jgi:hypothetical protein